jgi:hypothetical protein
MDRTSMQRAGAEHERLARLAGKWGGEEKMMPSATLPQGQQLMARIDARMAVDGLYLLVDYEQEHHGTVVYRGHGVLGWDTATGTYTQHWFDARGGHAGLPARGLWEGDTLRLTVEPTDKPGWRHLYVVGDGGYRMRIETSSDGHAWAPFLDGKYRKR